MYSCWAALESGWYSGLAALESGCQSQRTKSIAEKQNEKKVLLGPQLLSAVMVFFVPLERNCSGCKAILQHML